MCTLTINVSEVWSRKIFLGRNVFAVHLENVLNTSLKRFEDVLTEQQGQHDNTS